MYSSSQTIYARTYSKVVESEQKWRCVPESYIQSYTGNLISNKLLGSPSYGKSNRVSSYSYSDLWSFIYLIIGIVYRQVVPRRDDRLLRRDRLVVANCRRIPIVGEMRKEDVAVGSHRWSQLTECPFGNSLKLKCHHNYSKKWIIVNDKLYYVGNYNSALFPKP